jgi:hypothetical protein
MMIGSGLWVRFRGEVLQMTTSGVGHLLKDSRRAERIRSPFDN